MRNEAQILQTLDRFHRVDSTLDLHRVYGEVFCPLPLVSSTDNVSSADVPVDIAALFLVCEWAVTSQRPAEYRYLSALALIEMHSNALLKYGKEYVYVANAATVKADTCLMIFGLTAKVCYSTADQRTIKLFFRVLCKTSCNGTSLK